LSAAGGELDPVKRAALFIRMNDLLHAPGSGWDNDLWNLKDWYRDA
jgi:peptide/nickel transport system substrate-binding protein